MTWALVTGHQRAGALGPLVLVCGGRDFEDYKAVATSLDDLQPRAIVHGDARGADRLAKRWALARGIEQRPYPAAWRQQGRAAGVIRNQRMLDQEPDISLVLAFPGGRGTADMVTRAAGKGLPVVYWGRWRNDDR